jgi:hypothetical protein
MPLDERVRFVANAGCRVRKCLKLSGIGQYVFSVFDKTIIYPAPNK